MPVCSACHEEKPLNLFPRDASKPTGYKRICKSCHAATTRQKRKDNPDHARGLQRENYQKNHEKIIARDRARAERRKPTKRAYMRKYYKLHKREIRKRNDNWTKKNPFKFRAMQHKARARKRDAEGQYTGDDVERQYKAQHGKCYWCGKRLKKYHVDHYIPLNKNGTNWPDNIVISCSHCNCTKRDKLPHEWDHEEGRMFS